MKVHFIGIGGTGMGALAGMLADAGHDVRGSDEALYPPMSSQLAARGIAVFSGFAADHLDWGPDCVVVGNVCSKDHVEVVAARERGLPLESFPSLLEKLLLVDRESLVVAGTHGKTTTASVAAWLLRAGGKDPSFLIGGVPQNLGRGSHLGSGTEFVIEGDEYDTAFFDKKSKFLHYRPAVAILTGVEYDHADIFAGIEDVRAAFRAFVELIPAEGDLVVHLDDSEAMGIASYALCRVVTYRVSSERDGDVTAADYVAQMSSGGDPRRTRFEVFERGASLGLFTTQLLGRYNVANALAAIAMARIRGVDGESIREGLRSFRGVKRRQELLGVAQGVRIVEDFAHHPTACALTITAMRKRYPDKALHVCFEPRSATSRRRVFLEPYTIAFEAATQVYIGPLFRPDKIVPEDRLDPEALARGIRARGVPATAYADVDALLRDLVERVVPGDTVLVLSCGSFEGLPRRLLFALGDPVMSAGPEDIDAVNDLLDGYGLAPLVPSDAVTTLVVRSESGIVGCVSLESRGDASFLFGLAVRPERRGEGLGWVLGDGVMRYARTLGVKVVYLITGTAADFFAGKLGFRPIDFGDVDPAIRDTRNFKAAAGTENGVCMAFELP